MAADGAEDGGLAAGVEGDEEVALVVVGEAVALEGVGEACLFLVDLGDLFVCEWHGEVGKTVSEKGKLGVKRGNEE